MNQDELTQFIEQEDSDLIAATKKAVAHHLKTLAANGKEVFGYCLMTAEEIDDIIAPCGVANTIRYSEDTKDQFFDPDEWPGDSGEWGNEIFASIQPIVETHNGRFYQLHGEADDDSFEYDEQEMAFIASYHNTYVKTLGQLRSEGVFSPDAFLAVWVSDPDDWSWIQNAIRKLNPDTVLQNSNYL